MSLIQLTIKGISYSQTQSGAYALVLSEIEGTRTLPIIIGAFEAQSIAIALETEIRPPRPLTHDLFKTFSDTFGIKIKAPKVPKLPSTNEIQMKMMKASMTSGGGLGGIL